MKEEHNPPLMHSWKLDPLLSFFSHPTVFHSREKGKKKSDNAEFKTKFRKYPASFLINKIK